MIKFFSVTILLLTIFISFGQFKTCSMDECFLSSSTEIELCSTCHVCKVANLPILFSPVILNTKIDKDHFHFQQIAIKDQWPSSLFRPPIELQRLS